MADREGSRADTPPPPHRRGRTPRAHRCPRPGKVVPVDAMRRWMAGGWIVFGLVLASCGSGGDLGPSATVPTAPPATAAPDPFAVPDVIDEAYVNRVLAALDAALGDVVRLVLREKAVTPEAVERLGAIYEGVVLQLREASLRDDQRGGFAGYRTSPGNRATTTTDLINTGSACVFAAVEVDYSAVSTEIDEVQMQWIALRHRPSLGPGNPTPWVFIYDGFQQDLTEPEDPCRDL